MANEGSTLRPGEYAITPSQQKPAPPFAEAELAVHDASCRQSADHVATGGTVTVVTVADDAVSGTFELTFAGGSLRATFRAPTCLPGSFRGVCAATRCQNGAGPGESLCSGSTLEYCRQNDAGALSSGSVACPVASPSTPACVGAIEAGTRTAACCPSGKTSPRDPGCVGAP